MKSCRLESDAKIVLQKAGYRVRYQGYYLMIENAKGEHVCALRSSMGIVDNDRVVSLCEDVGCDQWGYPKKKKSGVV